jgi:hypothetical protein
LEDQNDGASSSRNTNFKPLLLNEIQASGDTLAPYNLSDLVTTIHLGQ